MNYISTRGKAPSATFADVMLGALAPDGGLYLPKAWPRVDDITRAATRRYQDIAFSILQRFSDESFSALQLHQDIAAAYAAFDDPEIAPLVELEPGLHLLELFHGPTLAFKDIALQLISRLVARELDRRNAWATILVATSGDTGSAAIAAFGGSPRVQIFVLHPKGRVSEVQRRQMTTSPHDNVYNIAIEGTFDDAQALVKALFADRAFSRAQSLTAVNSINFLRIIAQSVYYFTAAAILDQPARFIVPTGNFGDVFAGEAAMRMGLPVEGLVVATNANDILARALNDGLYAAQDALSTLSPSMDIQVASNFERALFEASNRNHVWVSEAMDEFTRERRMELPLQVLAGLRARYQASSISDGETLETIRDTHRRYRRLVDPHTAVGIAVGRRTAASSGTPTIVVATAHPAKFPETVARATGMVPPLPQRLKQSYLGPERFSVLPNDALTLRAFIEARSAHP
ncbi:MAG TPA: threonine synthase [Rhizomicrobium sp.]|jgi:threonine synthase|nr:threonine synthase [Rhizomicrobium sp.]